MNGIKNFQLNKIEMFTDIKEVYCRVCNWIGAYSDVKDCYCPDCGSDEVFDYEDSLNNEQE